MNTRFKHRRSHGIVIFEDSIKGLMNFIIPFAITLLPAFKSGKLGNILVAAGVFLIFFGIETVYSLLAWYFKTYSVENGIFRLEYGVFIKKNREIPIQKIVTLQEMQTLTQRVFKAWTIKLDTGSSQLKETEAKLVVSETDLSSLRHLLNPHIQTPSDDALEDTTEPKSDIVYEAKPSSLVKLGLTSNAIFAGFAVILSLFQFLSDFFDKQIQHLLGEAQNLIERSAIKMTLQLLVTLLFILLIYSVLSLGTAVLSSLIKYHGFKVLKDKDSLTIQYGLLKRNSFTLLQSKINAVYMRQGILRQWFSLVSVHIESVGYGNEKGEEALLIPLIPLHDTPSVLSHILENYTWADKRTPVPKRSLRKFI
ncbi:MAG: PH domain-containing protein, partial [Clostridia bacterium]|nr:PH domain-containing protein [Clostridia bacterium]